jgi:hypothetical protein
MTSRRTPARHANDRPARARRGALRAVMGVAACLAVLLGAASSAGGVPTRTPDRGTPDDPAAAPIAPSIRITSATPWVEPDGDFRVELRVDGPVPPDAELRAVVHQRLRASRSTSLREAVERAVAGERLPGRMQTPPSRPLSELGDPAVGVVLDLPVRSDRSGDPERILVPSPGIHPVSIAVTDAAGEELASTVVFLNRLPEELPTTRDGAPGTVSLTLVTTVDGPAALAPDGRTDLDDATRRALSDAAALVSSVPQAPLTLAIRPNLLDALARSEDATDQEVLRQLRAVVDAPDHPVAVARMPYVAIDTGGLMTTENGGAEVLRQVALGEETISETLGVDPVRTTWYDDDTITTPALEMLEAFGVRRLVTAAGRLRLTDRSLDPDLVTEAAVGVVRSPLTATAPDPDLTELLVGDEGVGQRVNQIMTSLMATWFTAAEDDEGFPGPSAVLSIPPSTDPAVVAALLAPLSATGPITAAADEVPTRPAVVDGEDVTAQLPTQGDAVLGPVVREVIATRDEIDGFRSMAPTATAEADDWDLLDAQTLDRAMSAGERDAFHDRIRADIAALVARIEMPKPRRVLITSERSTIPLRFRNDLPYPVEVELWIRSVRLEVDGPDRRRVTLHPGENRIDVDVTARAPGGTNLRLDASSPDGRIALPAVTIPVTSQTISGVGAALSVLSLLFLAGWWFVTVRRDRRRRREGPDEPPEDDGPGSPSAGGGAGPTETGTADGSDGAGGGTPDDEGIAVGSPGERDDEGSPAGADPPIVVRRRRGARARASSGR